MSELEYLNKLINRVKRSNKRNNRFDKVVVETYVTNGTEYVITIKPEQQQFEKYDGEVFLQTGGRDLNLLLDVLLQKFDYKESKLFIENTITKEIATYLDTNNKNIEDLSNTEKEKILDMAKNKVYELHESREIVSIPEHRTDDVIKFIETIVTNIVGETN